MRLILDILGIFFLCFGVFFSLVGVMGVLRFPDVYSRLHASGKISALGLMGLLVSMALLMPATAPKIVVLGIFMLGAAPVTSHAIAAAAYRRGRLRDRVLSANPRQSQVE